MVYRRAVTWLAFALTYLIYSLIRGAIVGWYPYPFMDPSQHGYLGMIVTSNVIAVILAVLTGAVANTPRVNPIRRPIGSRR